MSITEALYAKNINNFVWVNNLLSFSGSGSKKLDINYKLANSEDNYKDYLISSLYEEFKSTPIPIFEFYILDMDIFKSFGETMKILREKLDYIILEHEIEINDYSKIPLDISYKDRKILISAEILDYVSKAEREVLLDESYSDDAIYFIQTFVENILSNINYLNEAIEFYRVVLRQFYEVSRKSKGYSYIKLTIKMQIIKENNDYFFKYIFNDFYTDPESTIDEKTDLVSNIVQDGDKCFYGSIKVINDYNDYNNLASLSDVSSVELNMPNPLKINEGEKEAEYFNFAYNRYEWFTFTSKANEKTYIVLKGTLLTEVVLDEYEGLVKGYSIDGLLQTHKIEYVYEEGTTLERRAIIFEIEDVSIKEHYFKVRNTATSKKDINSFLIYSTSEFPSGFQKI